MRIVLRLQLKVAYWNVRGPQFIALHKLFDESVEDADEYAGLKIHNHNVAQHRN